MLVVMFEFVDFALFCLVVLRLPIAVSAQGEFPVMAEITCILNANTRRQFCFGYRHCSEFSLLG